MDRDELKRRACERVAIVIKGHVHDNTGIHSRIFEVLIADKLIIVGKGILDTNYREHVIPCSLIRDECVKMFKSGATIKDVTSLIEKSLAIVLISNIERVKLDNELGLKTKMPNNWSFSDIDKNNVFDRLHAADINYTLHTKTELDDLARSLVQK